MKLLIVDDQISNQFLLVEQIQAHLKFKDSDIRIASNGLEAIAVAEQNDLDLILMDLQMPVMNGLNATKKIISKYPYIKVIIITSSDDIILVQKSIMAGARGYLFKDNILTNLISVIQNVSNGYTVFPKYDTNSSNLLSSCDSIIQLNESEKILKINKIIALEIITIWKNGIKDNNFVGDTFLNFFDINFSNKKDLINFLIRGDSSKCNLLQELELRFHDLISKCIDEKKIDKDNLESELDIVIERVNCWFYTEQTNNFSCFRTKIETNAQILRINYAKQLKKYIDSFLFKTASLPCLEHLESMETLLKNIIEEYQSELDKFTEQEKSAFQAYNVLIDIFFESASQESNQSEINSLTRTILHIYRAKMQIEAFTFAIQDIQGIIRTLQFYIDDLILANNLLETIHSQLDISGVDESISLLVKHKFDTFQDSTKLLQEIEAEVGYSMNQWGVQCHVNPSLILDKLITKISISSGNILESIEQELYV
ncbi:response regulator transcription factor [Waterburya agarophytonicola K14]|uniref:Response regulator transcription factor n=1 Tax=Waterburya agarophytonicola KI4 TaxID=2874699 RepID=A0A964BLY8_9CYAN|nr:response regulator transcription factor [Waterburya agarophytonicola]MCC0175849.1 response regulator transcription factor [Waterburya agarophytonicola KI4]